jgi:glyoxylase-like metal-dependent hydrolase (beta-lactamase superfamily II)
MYEINEICQGGQPLSLKTDDNKLRVIFIGTGSAFTKRRRQSNMLIIQGDYHLLVDCGTQGPLALNDLGLSVTDVTTYLPTHSHADHIGGFEEIALVNRYIATKPVKPKLIILRDYQDLLWSKSLAGGSEFCEAEQGQPLQRTNFFEILRPTNTEISGRKFWKYKHHK